MSLSTISFMFLISLFKLIYTCTFKKLLAAKQLSESTFSEDSESSPFQMSFVASCFQSATYMPASDQEAPVLRHTNVISMNSIALVGLIATFTWSSLRSIVSYVLFFSSHCSL